MLVVGADNQSQRSDGQEWWTDESHEIVSSDGKKTKSGVQKLNQFIFSM